MNNSTKTSIQPSNILDNITPSTFILVNKKKMRLRMQPSNILDACMPSTIISLNKKKKTRLKRKDGTDDDGVVQDLEGEWLRPRRKARDQILRQDFSEPFKRKTHVLRLGLASEHASLPTSITGWKRKHHTCKVESTHLGLI